MNVSSINTLQHNILQHCLALKNLIIKKHVVKTMKISSKAIKEKIDISSKNEVPSSSSSKEERLLSGAICKRPTFS